MTDTFTLPPKPPSLDTVLAEAGLKTGGPTQKGSSFWSTFELCPYDARMIELFGYDSGDYSPALVTGVLVHECLAQWYLTYEATRARKPIALVRAWAERMLTSEHAAYAKMVWNSTTEAESLMNIYLGRPQHPAPFNLTSVSNADFDIPRETVRMVEQVIEYTGLFKYSARIDLVVEIQDEDGPCVAIVDHKTMRTYKTEWTEAFWQDLQFVGLPYLWQKVMEPAGFPPCRYVIANGLVKSPDHPARRFVRSVYPVRQNRLAKFEAQMALMWRRYLTYSASEEDLAQRAPLSSVWPQQWAACQTRRYGRGSYTGDPEEVGEHLPGGGRCHRFGSCMFDEEYMIGEYKQIVREYEQGLQQELDPCTAAEQELIAQGYLKPEPAPEFLEFDPNIGLVPKAIADQLAPQSLESVEPDSAPTAKPEELNQDPRTPGVFYRFPIAKDQSDVISLEDCSPEQYLLYQIPPGECIYLRGTVYWVTDLFEGDNRKLILPGCPTLVEFNANTLAYICAPTLRQEKPPKETKDQPKEEPSTDPSSGIEKSTQTIELNPSVSLQDGWAAISVVIPPTSEPYPTVVVTLKYKDAADTVVSRLNLDRQGFIDVIPDLVGILEQSAVEMFCIELSKQILDLEGRPKQATPAVCGGGLEVLTKAVVEDVEELTTAIVVIPDGLITTAEVPPQSPQVADDRQLVIPGVNTPVQLPINATQPEIEPKAKSPVDHHGEVVGSAPMVGVGIAPVLFVGGFTKGGVLLHPNYKDLWERTKSPFYAAAMIGRIPDNRKLSLVGVKGPSEFEVMNKTAVGEITWKQIESSIQALKVGL